MEFIATWDYSLVVRVFIALISGSLLWLGVKNYSSLRALKKLGIPGPKPTLFVGNLLELRADGRMPHETISKWIGQYGNVFGMYYGSLPSLVINHPEILKEVMVRHFSNFTNRSHLDFPVSPLSESLFFTKHDKWRNARRLLTPAFSASKLKALTKAMNEQTDVLVEELIKTVGENVDFVERFQALTLDVIGKCAMAFDANCQRNPRDDFLWSVRNYVNFSSNALIRLAVGMPFLSAPLMFFNKYLTAGKFLDVVVKNLKNIIARRREEASNQTVDLLQLMLDAEDNSLNANEDGVSVTSETKRRLTDIEVIGNSYLFLVAGYETTAATLGFAFHLLATHPEIQETLYQEIIETLKDVATPTYEEVFSLTYLDQVLNETMRLYPPVPHFLIRQAQKDIQIEDVFIPKGVIVQAPVWQLHHDPRHWSEPQKFDPDRFSPEKKASIRTGTFLPFGIGPRNCIGFRFAQLEMKLAVVKILRLFKVVPSARTEIPLPLGCPSILLRAKNGVNLSLVARSEA